MNYQSLIILSKLMKTSPTKATINGDRKTMIIFDQTITSIVNDSQGMMQIRDWEQEIIDSLNDWQEDDADNAQ
ncbi:8807_t:CDS:2 [Scutellospora calospora]|uniref:8807_t:CDS:1 n=1 Tax=Scutellospora calospora TaxID=85575 RepID=A0ACA9KR21_9GLOM|nr:8807_t:CDS:2 [Scutellospora calospora]